MSSWRKQKDSLFKEALIEGKLWKQHSHDESQHTHTPDVSWRTYNIPFQHLWSYKDKKGNALLSFNTPKIIFASHVFIRLHYFFCIILNMSMRMHTVNNISFDWTQTELLHMYSSVPIGGLNCLRKSGLNVWALPKSIIFMRFMWVTMIFSGLISRCRMRRAWR